MDTGTYDEGNKSLLNSDDDNMHTNRGARQGPKRIDGIDHCLDRSGYKLLRLATVSCRDLRGFTLRIDNITSLHFKVFAV